MSCRSRAIAVPALLVALGTGCASRPEETRMDSAAELASRSTSAEAVTRYEQMQKQIRDQLDATIGPRSWKVNRVGDQALCGGRFNNSGGIVVYLPAWGFLGPIPDADWPRAKQVITDIAARYGFTQPTLQIDQPGHHETSSLDPTLGAQFGFVAGGNIDMQATTGCHRPS